jgi:hypothetical protein
MARANAPLLGFNRGLISPKALGRVDLDRTKLSAEVMTNWLPKSQGAMSIRPGTKCLGSSHNDTGATWIEFVAATDDTALIELTDNNMRVWVNDTVLVRPTVTTSLSLTDTGWFESSSTAIVGTTVVTSGSAKVLTAAGIGALTRIEKRVIVSGGNIGVEHSLLISLERGPVIIRVGSTQLGDDYISETSLGTGYHNLAFTPSGDFWITFQTNEIVNRIVSAVEIGAPGVVDLTTFIDSANLADVRYDQSADVVYIDCKNVHPAKIERRGTGRSWSFVTYEPSDGPFIPGASTSAKLRVTALYGNIGIISDIPFFSTNHVGALFRLTYNGQGGIWPLAAAEAATDAIKVTGISDTGTPSNNDERFVQFSVAGSWAGTIQVERSFEGPDVGFHPVIPDFMAGVGATDTGSFGRDIHDGDNNITAWYRARITDYDTGVAIVSAAYSGGGTSSIARVTAYGSSQSVFAEVLGRPFSCLQGEATDAWQEGYWSAAQSFPSAVALHEGRLGHSSGGNMLLSVSDDYESFDDTVEGDAAPIIKTLGSGPVDKVYYLISLLRLIIGTAGAEIAMRSSSLDEPLTPSNSNARAFSTQGSENMRAVKMDTKAIFVQRSGQRAFVIGFSQGAEAIGDYEASELTMLVPDLMESGVVSVAVQRQPDTRIHFVLADGTVAILTYEPKEEVVCWSMWETDGSVEKAMVLPGLNEDQVYYHVNRVIEGTPRRYLEKWALESECRGDTGLSWLADSAVDFTDTGRTATIQGVDHLRGESVIVWGDDTGNSYPSKDYSPDVNGVQTTYVVDTGGNVNLTSGTVHHAVVGLPYHADYRSTKLAYAAQAGTALAQMKRTDKIGLCLYQTHNNGIFFGSDTGNLDALPRKSDEGGVVDSRKIFRAIDLLAMPFPGLWNTDSRIQLHAKAPRPVTVLAAVPTIQTNEKI